MDNGVRGLSACSVISILFYNSHLTRLSPSVPAAANAPHLKQKLQEASARKVFGRSLDGPRSPTEEEPGKGRAQQGTTSGTTGEKLALAGA